MRWILGTFLMFHGMIHGFFLMRQPAPRPGAPVWPFRVDRSWLFSGLGVRSAAVKTLGQLLAGLTGAGFLVAGGGLLFGQDWWRGAALLGAGCSLLLLVLYYHPWLLVGMAISAALIIGPIWLDGPPSQLIGL